MLIISVENLKEIHQKGDWFFFILEDEYKGGLRDEIRLNLEIFAEKIGPRNYVIQSHPHQKQHFSEEVVNEFHVQSKMDDKPLYNFLPALLIANGVPQKSDPNDLIRIFIPLREKYQNAGEIASLLSEIDYSIKQPDSEFLLKSYEKDKLEKTWGWISKHYHDGIILLGLGADVVTILSAMQG